ncbi:MAG: HsdR family type I site-specific deoxyribonuclease [Clostridia bacterium]|nr:HsdR family type I site-specific deoxyribonuclease [Clostridia bacterium]
MSKIDDIERKTQNRVIKFFVDKLHYTYLGDLHDSENSNIMQDHLYAYLTGKGGYSDKLARRAIDELVRTAGNLQHGLYDANKEVYRLLKYGAKVAEEAGEAPKTVFFLNFSDIAQNDFAIAEEVNVVGENTKRPDLVIYVNGIALAVIELKRSSVSVAEGIRQNLTNQKAHFIEKFFTTMQFCMAGNDSEGLRYGTLLTPEKHYYEWKDDGFTEFAHERSETDVLIEKKSRDIENPLDKQIFAMFYKKRFLDLVHNFIIFDKGIKKVCRYNQYYALKRAQHRLTEEKRGGIIWHTQGSGKTLSMIWLSKWILANNPNARVLIVTDREELDDQIEKAYKGVDENIVRTKSGEDLVNKLNSYENPLICSLIHKFGKNGGEATDKDIDKYIEEIKKALPKDYSAKGDFVVFVDECHRTQSGKLHAAMKTIIPNGIFVGFTGTPLLKKDKKTSLETFGGYIHTYKFDEAVRDKVVLDLRYEYRDVPQEIKSQDKIDAWFDIHTKGLTPHAQAKLKSKWATMQKVLSSRSRLEKIALDIHFDFQTQPRLMDGNGNAMLVADSVYSACKYYEIFQQIGLKKCAIITSYEPQASDLRTETVSDEEETEIFEKYEIYQKMLDGQSAEDFEKEAKRKFIEEPANMKLLIVVDKLLTGFDAPPCTYLYIDKAMHDHGLFQAICRVNRLDDESKDFGYIVDYKQLFGDLADAINTYTAGAFEDYDAEDVAGLIKDRTEEAKKYFLETLDALDELCEGVAMPRAELDYIHYFCGENGVDLDNDEAYARSREKLYKLVSRLVRAYAEFKPRMDDAGISSDDQAKFAEKVNTYIKLREVIGRASGDFLDFKQFEPGMRYLIDNYIVADDAEKIAIFDDFTLLDFIIEQEDKLNKDGKEQESAAEAIENNIRKKVVQKIVINPAYYSKMSEVLEQLILDRKRGVIAYKHLLERYLELAKNVSTPEENEQYPKSIRKSGAMRAFYDNCGEDEQLAIRLHKAVMTSKMDGFRNNPTKENRIKREIYKILKDEDMVERLYKIVVEQEEY